MTGNALGAQGLCKPAQQVFSIKGVYTYMINKAGRVGALLGFSNFTVNTIEDLMDEEPLQAFVRINRWFYPLHRSYSPVFCWGADRIIFPEPFATLEGPKYMVVRLPILMSNHQKATLWNLMDTFGHVRGKFANVTVDNILADDKKFSLTDITPYDDLYTERHQIPIYDDSDWIDNPNMSPADRKLHVARIKPPDGCELHTYPQTHLIVEAHPNMHHLPATQLRVSMRHRHRNLSLHTQYSCRWDPWENRSLIDIMQQTITMPKCCHNIAHVFPEKNPSFHQANGRTSPAQPGTQRRSFHRRRMSPHPRANNDDFFGIGGTQTAVLTSAASTIGPRLDEDLCTEAGGCFSEYTLLPAFRGNLMRLYMLGPRDAQHIRINDVPTSLRLSVQFCGALKEAFKSMMETREEKHVAGVPPSFEKSHILCRTGYGQAPRTNLFGPTLASPKNPDTEPFLAGLRDYETPPAHLRQQPTLMQELELAADLFDIALRNSQLELISPDYSQADSGREKERCLLNCMVMAEVLVRYRRVSPKFAEMRLLSATMADDLDISVFNVPSVVQRVHEDCEHHYPKRRPRNRYADPKYFRLEVPIAAPSYKSRVKAELQSICSSNSREVFEALTVVKRNAGKRHIPAEVGLPPRLMAMKKTFPRATVTSI